MILRRPAIGLFLAVAILSLGNSRCAAQRTPSDIPEQIRRITILQTNDMHGALEPSAARNGTKMGGVAMLGSVVHAIRTGIEQRYGDQAGVLMLDSGDQFQGTLLSNYDEGQSIFAAMNEIGYDAAILGNHAYDFGPVGWLDDQVNAANADKNPRGALLRLLDQAKFSVLAANTYMADSMVDQKGAPVDVDGSNCKPIGPARGANLKKIQIDWTRAARVNFAKPYVIKNVAGVRVALIGLDSAQTPQTTTIANVADLCFRDPIATYVEVREEIGDKADVFVALLHEGNTATDFQASEFAKALTTVPGRGPLVDAVIAGHTHFINKPVINGVPVIQSGSSAKMIGRIDLFFDTKAKSMLRDQTKMAAGVELLLDACAKDAPFCSVDEKTQGLIYEGVPLVRESVLESIVERARAHIAPLANRKLGVADGVLTIDRTDESSLADRVTDVLREVSGADVVFLNTGGLRAPIQSGDVSYEDFFAVMPNNNRGVFYNEMPLAKVISMLARSVKTCGMYGAALQSGLRVVFERDCDSARGIGIDNKAKLLSVEMLSGEVLFADGLPKAAPTRTLRVATTDFIANGGSGFDAFKDVAVSRDMGVVRDIMADHLAGTLKGETHFSDQVDNRWKETRRGTPSVQ